MSSSKNRIINLRDYKRPYIKEVIQSLKKNSGVKAVAPTHCTGQKAEQLFKKEFGNHYHYLGVGSELAFA